MNGTIPLEATMCLPYLNTVSEAVWEIVEKANEEGDNKTIFQALPLTHESALPFVNVLPNNKALMDEAFKSASTSSTSSGDEESSGQDQKQEEEDEDDLAEDN